MSSFEVSRSTHIAAEPAAIHALLDDFHRWPEWSPWEELDPAMRREHSGARAGAGARYAWSGNRKAGAGRMEITSSEPDRVGLEIQFFKPMKATNQIAFELTARDGGTDVDWRMTGEQRGIAAIFGKFVSMDRLVGGDFEKGLAKLKAAAEA